MNDFNQVNPAMAHVIGGPKGPSEAQLKVERVKNVEALVLGVLPFLVGDSGDKTHGEIVDKAFLIANYAFDRIDRERRKVLLELQS